MVPSVCNRQKGNTTTNNDNMTTINLLKGIRKQKDIRVEAMRLAHRIYKWYNYSSFSEALQHAWNKVRLQKRMSSLCCFTFKKKTLKKGETEEDRMTMRMGTRNSDNYTWEFCPNWTDKSSWYIVRFWDTVKYGWRSLDCRTLEAIHW